MSVVTRSRYNRARTVAFALGVPRGEPRTGDRLMRVPTRPVEVSVGDRGATFDPLTDMGGGSLHG